MMRMCIDGPLEGEFRASQGDSFEVAIFPEIKSLCSDAPPSIEEMTVERVRYFLTVCPATGATVWSCEK